MKKYLLTAVMVVLIALEVLLLTLMSNGFDFKTMTFTQSDVTLSDVLPDKPSESVSGESSEVSSEAVSSEQSDDVSSQTTGNSPALHYDKLNVSLDSLGELKDYTAMSVGEGIGNHPANIYNGGYVVKYENAVYYTDVNSSNYLYYSRNDLKKFTKRNKLNSRYINIINDTIYYVCRTDGCIYYVPLKHDSSKKLDETNKKLSDKRAVCLIAAGDYLYYISPADDNSICGELRRMDLKGKNDTKLSPDGYVCENIIPCGDFVLFVCEQGSERKICAFESATSKITELYVGNVSDINYFDGNLWFIRHSSVSDEICCVESGTDKIKSVFSSANIDNLIVDKENVYYMTRSGYSKCFRMSTDGGESERVYDNTKAEMQFFNSTEDYIYFGVNGGKCMRRIAPDDDYVTILKGKK